MHHRYDATNVPTELLRTLVVVADIANVTRAATKLKLSQPAVTAQLKRLQSIVKTPLFTVDGSSRALTPAGTEVLKKAREILRLNDQILMQSRGGISHASLSIGMCTLFGGFYFEEVLKRIRVEVAHQEVQIVTVGPEDMRTLMESKVVDLALSPEIAGVPEDYASLHEWKEDTAWVAGDKFTFSSGGPVPVVSIAKSPVQPHACAALEKHGQTFFHPVVAQDWQSAVAALRAGFGIAPVPACFATGGLKIVQDSRLPKIPPQVVKIYGLNEQIGQRLEHLGDLLRLVVASRRPHCASAK